MTSELFAHVLLFRCPNCREPISSVSMSTHRSLEQIDSSQVEVKCDCAWSGEMIGGAATRHLVFDWNCRQDASPDVEPDALTSIYTHDATSRDSLTLQGGFQHG